MLKSPWIYDYKLLCLVDFYVSSMYFRVLRKKMKKLNIFYCFKCAVCLCLISAILICVSGCAGAGETASEVRDRHKTVVKSGLRMVQDDVDAFLLIDRPTKLSDKLTR